LDHSHLQGARSRLDGTLTNVGVGYRFALLWENPRDKFGPKLPIRIG
jgi:hypothetical protein